MTKWFKQFKLDITGQEGKSKLSFEEKQLYTLGVAIGCFIAAIAFLFVQFSYSWAVSIGFFLVGARKFYIYRNNKP